MTIGKMMSMVLNVEIGHVNVNISDLINFIIILNLMLYNTILRGVKMKLSKYNFEVSLNETQMIVLNTLENVYMLFEHQQYQKLYNNLDLFIKENPIESNFLISNGFIISDQKDELLQAKESYLKKCYNSSVFNATIIPTLQCNLKCDYCFIEQNPIHMSNKTITKTVDFLNDIIDIESPNLKHFNVKWFGGEPLLHPEIIEKISLPLIQNCKRHKISYHSMIYSNLTLINDKIIETLKKSNIKKINTTLDGFREKNDIRRVPKNKEYGFDNIINNIKNLKNDFDINIQINIDRRNQQDVLTLIDFLINAHIIDGKHVTVGFNFVNDNHNIVDKSNLLSYENMSDINYIDTYYKKLGNLATHSLPTPALNCFAIAKNSVIIDPLGSLYKCFKDTKTNIAFGSLYESKDKWNNAQYQGLLHDPFNNLKCTSCSVFPLCYGGCPNFGSKQQICSLKYILEHKIRRYFNDFIGENNDQNCFN